VLLTIHVPDGKHVCVCLGKPEISEFIQVVDVIQQICRHTAAGPSEHPGIHVNDENE
jgi:hypothetical protein